MATLDYTDFNTKDPAALSVGEPTIPRRSITTSGGVTSSGTLRMSFFTAKKTETITQVRIVSGGTAAGATPTLIRIGIYQVDDITGDLTLVASTPNDTTLLAAASTQYTKALSASFLKVKGVRYAVGLCIVTAAATPTLLGISVIPAAEAFMAPHMCASSAQTDLPATITDASLTSVTTNPYIVLLP